MVWAGAAAAAFGAAGLVCADIDVTKIAAAAATRGGNSTHDVAAIHVPSPVVLVRLQEEYLTAATA